MSMKFSIPKTWRERKPHYLLEATKCKNCGKIHYPPRTVCDKCGSRDLERTRLSGEGRIVSYTVQYVVLDGFRDYAPIIYAIVELKEGIKVLAPLTDVKPGDVKTGLKVKAVLRKVSEDGKLGLIRYAIKFKPLEAESQK